MYLPEFSCCQPTLQMQWLDLSSYFGSGRNLEFKSQLRGKYIKKDVIIHPWWQHDVPNLVSSDYLHTKEKKTPIFFNPLLFCNFLLFLLKPASNWYIEFQVWLRTFLLLSPEAKQAWMWINTSAERKYSTMGKISGD